MFFSETRSKTKTWSLKINLKLASLTGAMRLKNFIQTVREHEMFSHKCVRGSPRII